MFGLPLIQLGEWYLPEEISDKRFAGLNIYPILGKRVTCGLFGISDDYIEKYQSLDTRFVKNRASTFFFQAASDSMEPLIFEHDVLVVDRSVEARHGKVVIVSVGGEMICKRYMIKQEHVVLQSDNPSYADIVVTEEMDMCLFGVVTAIARELA